ncbi:MAG: YCF48-related protein [Melioribacteraceae bacterium]|nr:YCF48-related protein [Melioribacteraceae bacterium]
MKNLIYLILLLVIISFNGCKKDNPTEPDNNNKAPETIINDKAKPIDDELRNNLTITDTSNFTMTLPSSMVSQKNIKVGDILVDKPSSKARYGFLRTITSIQSSGANATITTSQATLKDVIKQGKINIKKAKLSKSNLESIKLMSGAKLSKSNVLNKQDMIGIDWNFDNDLYKSGNNYVNINGNFLFDIDLNFDLEVDLTGVDYFKTSVEVNQDISMRLKSNFSKELSDVKIPFAKAIFNPIVFVVGIIPVVLVPEVTLYIGANGKVTAETESWCKESFTGEYGLEYKNDNWNPIKTDNFQKDYLVPNTRTGNSFKAFVGPKTSIKLYGVAGPYVSLDAISELKTTAAASGVKIDFLIAFECNAGAEVEVLGWELLNYSKQIFVKEIYRYTNNGGTTEKQFKITYPSPGLSVVKGDLIKITTFSSGDNPNYVKFFIDDKEVYTDNSAPYEYEWMTQNFSAGGHSIKTIAYYSNLTLEAVVSVSIREGNWTKIDIGNLLGASEIIHRIYFLNESVGFAVGGAVNTSFILKTTDGGNSWKRVLYKNGPEDHEVTDIIAENSSVLYAITDNYLYLSTDNGESWNPFQPSGEVYSRIGGSKMAIGSEGLIIAGYGSFYLKTSSQDGTAWKEIPNYIDIYVGSALAIKYLSGKKIVVLDRKDNNYGENRPLHLLFSYDGGYTWESKALNIPFEWEPVDMDFADDTNGWIVGKDQNDRGFILSTNNGGDSWQLLVDPVKEELFSLFAVDFTDYQHGFTAGSLVDLEQGGISWHQGILSSNNKGINWSNHKLNNYDLNGEVRTLFFLDINNGWAAGSKKVMYKYKIN